MPGVANQSETKKRHIPYCIAAKSNIIHTGTHEHHFISSSHTRNFLLYSTRFLTKLKISHTNGNMITTEYDLFNCKYHTPSNRIMTEISNTNEMIMTEERLIHE